MTAMDAFVLTNATLNMCLEIPSADDGGEFDPVELHAHCHGGLSQAGAGVVLWAISPDLRKAFAAAMDQGSVGSHNKIGKYPS